MDSAREPQTLLEAVSYFADVDRCVEFVAQLRWPDGAVCPSCGGKDHSYLTTRRVWKCKACKRQFSVKVGTIFEDSALGLDKWLPAIWLIANSKNGVSSHELGRATGMTQKSAWFVLHRIRLAMQTGSFDKLDGEVEADETYVGGKARNRHKSQRGNSVDKAVVVGVVQRGGKVRAAVVEDPTHEALRGHIDQSVERTATVYTDAHPAYESLWEYGYKHGPINHSVHYVDGRVHTNTIENFWSVLKRGLHGTYVSVKPFHLFRYVDERAFTYNERGLTDLERFKKVVTSAAGLRLTYAELTGKA